MTIKDALTFGHTQLKQISDSPHLDADILLCNVLKIPKGKLISMHTQELKKNQEQKFLSQIKRRKSGEPIAYITGHKEFFGLDFVITPDTLIPRPATETLIDIVLKHLKAKSQ